MARNKVLVLRGISGSGKSTFTDRLKAAVLLEADRVQDPPPCFVVVSADKHMVNSEGQYCFDPRRLSEVHQKSLRSFMLAIVEKERNGKLIVVDNTNTTLVEMAPYVQLALAMEWEVKVLTFLCEPSEAYSRSRHGVPSASLLKQHLRLLNDTPQIPLNWNSEILLTPEILEEELGIYRAIFCHKD